MSLVHLLEKLRKVDEITLMELLEISSSELVDAFVDKIVEREEHLYGQVGEDETDE
jgi:hypothetical protein